MTAGSPAVAEAPGAVKGGCSLKRKRPPRIEIPSVLREIGADGVVGRWKGRDLTKEEGVVGGNGVAVLGVRGQKKVMEDAYKVACLSQGDCRKGFFGVYDGHGGKKAAEFVAEKLHTNILEMIENCDGNCSKEEAIKAGFLKTDQEFLDQGVGSGTCCITALIDGKEIAVSNLGDCRAVLCRGGVAEALTTDHRAGCEDEKNRIEEKGGYVEFHHGAWRIHGILSVSRSVGDSHLKNWVSADPETKILELSSDMEYLILASDGLWDQVSNQEAVDIVTRSCAADKMLGSPSQFRKSHSDPYGCVCSSPSPKIKRVSLLKPQDPVSESLKCDRNGTENEFSTGLPSPAAKPWRIPTLPSVRTPTRTPRSPNPENVTGWSASADETESPPPPLKLRRVSVSASASRRTPTTPKLTSSPNRENIVPTLQPQSAGLAAACRELVSLAVKRGSMDDVSVMVIDLTYFRSSGRL